MTPTADERLRRAQEALLDSLGIAPARVPFEWRGGASEALVLGEGPPMLLVHGGTGTAFQWAPILARLAMAHRVVAIDRPGNGLAPPFPYEGVNIEAHAADFLTDAMDALALRAPVVVGNSMGGRWAIALALREPARVARLVLVGVPAGGEGRTIPFPVRALRLPGLRAIVRRAVIGGDAASSRSFYGQCLVARPERLSDAFSETMAADAARNIDSWLSFMRTAITLGGRLRPPLDLDEERLGRLRVPTHLVWGEEDAFGPLARARALAAAIPGARLTLVPGAGHIPWLDEPDAVADAILQAARGAAGRAPGGAPGAPAPGSDA